MLLLTQIWPLLRTKAKLKTAKLPPQKIISFCLEEKLFTSNIQWSFNGLNPDGSSLFD